MIVQTRSRQATWLCETDRNVINLCFGITNSCLSLRLFLVSIDDKAYSLVACDAGSCSFLVPCIWRWCLSPKYRRSPSTLPCCTPRKTNTSPFRCITSNAIQVDPSGKVSIVGGDITGNCVNVCLIRNVYAHEAARIPRPNSINFSFVMLDKKRSLKVKISSWFSCYGCDVRYVQHIIT